MKSMKKQLAAISIICLVVVGICICVCSKASSAKTPPGKPAIVSSADRYSDFFSSDCVFRDASTKEKTLSIIKEAGWPAGYDEVIKDVSITSGYALVATNKTAYIYSYNEILGIWTCLPMASPYGGSQFPLEHFGAFQPR